MSDALLLDIDHCDKCGAWLTSADDEGQQCSQCHAPLPRLRRLLLRVASALPIDTNDDYQKYDGKLRWADVRLARELLQ